MDFDVKMVKIDFDAKMNLGAKIDFAPKLENAKIYDPK